MWQYAAVFLFVAGLVSAMSIVSYRNGVLSCETKNEKAIAQAVENGSKASQKARDIASRTVPDDIDLLLDRRGWLRKND